MLDRNNVKPESNFYGVPTGKNIPTKDNLPVEMYQTRQTPLGPPQVPA